MSGKEKDKAGGVGEWASVLGRVAKGDLDEEVTFEPRSEGSKGASHVATWGRVSWAEGTASAKALRQDPVWHI